jgi:hypothetical protein
MEDGEMKLDHVLIAVSIAIILAITLYFTGFARAQDAPYSGYLGIQLNATGNGGSAQNGQLLYGVSQGLLCGTCNTTTQSGPAGGAVGGWAANTAPGNKK